MICKTECFLSAAFIGASIYMMISDKSTPEFKNMYNSLTKEKREAYNKIKKERLLIWVKASVIAIFVSILFAYYRSSSSGSPFNISCLTTLIFYGVQYLVYMMHPKSDYMLNHVENNKQAKAWLSKYKTMQRKWHLGFILGIVGYYLLNITFFKNKETGTFRTIAFRIV